MKLSKQLDERYGVEDIQLLLRNISHNLALVAYSFALLECETDPYGRHYKLAYEWLDNCARDYPAKAIEMVEVNGKLKPLFHLGRGIFCYQCAGSCLRNAIKSSEIFELASTNKSDLVVKPKANNASGGSLWNDY